MSISLLVLIEVDNEVHFFVLDFMHQLRMLYIHLLANTYTPVCVFVFIRLFVYAHAHAAVSLSSTALL